MKHFLRKIAIASIIVFLLAWGLDWIISRGQTMIGGYPQQTWREIRNGEIDADALIMGTSRGLEHYDPAVLESITGLKFYNLGMGAYPINVELMKLNCYLRHNAKPKYILYDINYITMSIGGAVHQHQSEQFLPLFYEKEMRADLRSLGFTWLDEYCPLYRYWGYQTEIKRGIFEFLHLKHYCDYPSVRGHMPDPGAWNGESLIFMDSIENVVADSAKVLLNRFMYECEQNGICVFLVNSPLYYACSAMEKYSKEEKSYFDSLANAFSGKYWDYATDYWMNYDSCYFNAGVHLTPEGTKVFSREFGRDMLNGMVKFKYLEGEKE